MQTRAEINAILKRWGVQWQEWPKGESAYRLVGAQETPHVEIKVRVEDQEHQALDSVPVLFHYPENFPDALYQSDYNWPLPHSTGDVVLTEEGLARMTMSQQWIVGDPSGAAVRQIETAVMIADPLTPSDVLESVGMLAGPKSHMALRLTFQKTELDYVPIHTQLIEIRQMIAGLSARVDAVERRS